MVEGLNGLFSYFTVMFYRYQLLTRRLVEICWKVSLLLSSTLATLECYIQTHIGGPVQTWWSVQILVGKLPHLVLTMSSNIMDFTVAAAWIRQSRTADHLLSSACSHGRCSGALNSQGQMFSAIRIKDSQVWVQKRQSARRAGVQG